MRTLLIGGAGLALTACAPSPAVPIAPAVADLVVALSPPRPPLKTMALSRRWGDADVFQFEVSLRRWDGDRFMDLAPALTVVLPRKDASEHEARFTNLRAGMRYRAEVVAKGNVGGTAPDMILNAQEPSGVDFDLTGAQDVENVHYRSLSVRLDSVPFSGTLELLPQNVPTLVHRFSVDLRDAVSGESRFAGSFAKTQTLTLSNLRAGISYRVLLTALRANGKPYRSVESEVVHFDPAAPELEQDRSLAISF